MSLPETQIDITSLPRIIEHQSQWTPMISFGPNSLTNRPTEDLRQEGPCPQSYSKLVAAFPSIQSPLLLDFLYSVSPLCQLLPLGVLPLSSHLTISYINVTRTKYMIPISFPCNPRSFKPFTSHIATSIIGQTAKRLCGIYRLNSWVIELQDVLALPYANTYSPCENSLTTLWQGCEYCNKLSSSKIECIRMSPDSAPPQIATHSSRFLSYLPLRLFTVENQERNVCFPLSGLIFALIFLFGSWPASFVSRTSKWEHFLGSTYIVVSDQTHSGMTESPRILLAREGSLNTSKQKEKRISVLFLIKAISLISKNILTLKM